jgi:PadR family transcriptional regulator, regulatory protein PadR
VERAECDQAALFLFKSYQRAGKRAGEERRHPGLPAGWRFPIDCLPRGFSGRDSDLLECCASKRVRNALAVDHLWEYKTTYMAKRGAPPLQADLLQGTLDLLILQTLVLGAAHGHTIAHVIEHRSDAVLQVEHGSLYPALHRLEDRGWIASFWGTSENNRKARYYRLTASGRRQLAQQTSRWEQLVGAVNRVLSPAKE